MNKIIGITVGTPTSPAKMGEELKPVKTVNGISPDENGNVDASGFKPDWNQNDPTAQDYVKNRPFYSEESWAVVHEERTVHFMTNSYGIQSVWIHAVPHICDAYPVGTTCKVVIDGEEFIGVMKYQYNSGYFGNAHLSWHDLADTGESFCVASGGHDMLFIYTTKPVTMCKVSLSVLEGETIKKLDAKYLPDVVAEQKPLHFTGAVEASYDGSEEVTVEIPQGGGGEWKHMTVTLDEDVSEVEFAVPSAKKLFVISKLHINDTDNTVATGTDKVSVNINGRLAARVTAYPRSGGFYSVLEAEKIGSHTKTTKADNYPNGISFQAEASVALYGWESSANDELTTIETVRFKPITTTMLLKADCFWEVYYQ